MLASFIVPQQASHNACSHSHPPPPAPALHLPCLTPFPPSLPLPGQAKTASDKRHGDPEMGGLTSGEKATLSRGQTPKSLEGNPEKQEAADRYLAMKRGEKGVEEEEEEED
jgi:hypothetical protein